MASIRIPCLVGKTNKAGVTSWYWQPSATLAKAGWKALTLGKDQTAAIAAAQKRNDDVEAWKLGGAKPAEIRKRIQHSTVDALVARYRREVLEGIDSATGKRKIRATTAETYETGLKRLEVWAGKHPLAYVTPARIRALRDSVAKPRDQGGLGHSAAHTLLKTIRQVFAFAESVDLIPKKSNPATDFGLGASPPRRALWEADDEAAFIAAALDLNMPSMALAIELAIYSAQREADLIGFTAPQYQSIEILNPEVRSAFAGGDGSVMGWVLTQQKTSDDYQEVQMEIPFQPALRAKVERTIATNRARDRAAEPRRLLTYVLVDDATGLPWKKRGFITAWTKVINHAVKMTGRTNMKKLVWHDLRRTRVVRLRRRGMDPASIASITGHSPQSITMMLKVYGPIDRNITAAALAGAIDPPAPAAAVDDAAGAA